MKKIVKTVVKIAAISGAAAAGVAIVRKIVGKRMEKELNEGFTKMTLNPPSMPCAGTTEDSGPRAWDN